LQAQPVLKKLLKKLIELGLIPEISSNMENSNWDRLREELDSLQAIYSDQDQINFQNGAPLRDETFRFSLQLKSCCGENFKLRYELPPAYPNQAKPAVCIEFRSAVITKYWQDQLQKQIFDFIAAQSLDEGLLFSVANFCESELAFDNESGQTTDNSEFQGRSVKAKQDLKMFVIDVHTFDGQFSSSRGLCTLTIVGASGAKSVALDLPSPLTRGKTVSIKVMLDAKLLPITHVELANPTSDCWRPQWVRVRACDEDIKIHSMQWVQKGRIHNAFVTAVYRSNCKDK